MKRLFAQTSIVLAVSMLVLTACNRDADADKAADAAASTAAIDSAAADVAAAGPQKPANCPPMTGGDNLLGVKIGMNEATAKTALVCSNTNYQFSREEGEKDFYPVEGEYDDRLKINTVTLVADTGLDRVAVSLVGVKGAERVWGIDRRIEYTEATRPVTDTLLQGLTDKYGKLDFLNHPEVHEAFRKEGDPSGPDKSWPRIINSSDNQRLDSGSSVYRQCTGDAGRAPADVIGNFKDARKCGFVMMAKFTPSNSNPNLIQSFGLTIRNSRDTAKFLDEDTAKLSAILSQKKSEAAAAAAQEAAGANRDTPKL